MKLSFDHEDVMRLMKVEAERILCPPPGWHVDVFLRHYESSGEAWLVKDAEEGEK